MRCFFLSRVLYFPFISVCYEKHLGKLETGEELLSLLVHSVTLQYQPKSLSPFGNIHFPFVCILLVLL